MYPVLRIRIPESKSRWPAVAVFSPLSGATLTQPTTNSRATIRTPVQLLSPASTTGSGSSPASRRIEANRNSICLPWFTRLLSRRGTWAPYSTSFPWTEYESGSSLTSPPRATNVPSGGAGPRRSVQAPTSLILVQIPDHPNGYQLLRPAHPVAPLLSQSALASRYRILSPTGQTLGFLAEEERGFSGTLLRQLAGTHWAFQASISDSLGVELLRIRRPFSLINSRIFAENSSWTENPQERAMVGESQQEFHLWRRRDNLFARLGRSDAAQDEVQQPMSNSPMSTPTHFRLKVICILHKAHNYIV
ncbi:hypothetical protein PtA15_14A205 [Puccinia triticina]|uniref:Phospholipid scramblase n=1 Tax=Puccinia triticina TaxID=208348 RepID=A0ABY7D4X2_9BASI|nr:uncharacterized protein PtA15_14A205 [Puccinia triticina]WAQ91322.1 hypothetical protein PtA15_14A205 [Puccinia triticina]